MEPLDTMMLCFFKIRFNIILPVQCSCLGFKNWSVLAFSYRIPRTDRHSASVNETMPERLTDMNVHQHATLERSQNQLYSAHKHFGHGGAAVTLYIRMHLVIAPTFGRFFITINGVTYTKLSTNVFIYRTRIEIFIVVF